MCSFFPIFFHPYLRILGVFYLKTAPSAHSSSEAHTYVGFSIHVRILTIIARNLLLSVMNFSVTGGGFRFAFSLFYWDLWCEFVDKLFEDLIYVQFVMNL